MSEKMTKAVFCRKAIHIGELKGLVENDNASAFLVEKVVEITPEEFKALSQELYEHYRVFYEEKDSMYIDDKQCFHCILLTTPEHKEGILAEAEGFAYARYTAYVPDCGKLNLSKAEKLVGADMSHNLPQEYWNVNLQVQKAKKQAERQVR